MKDVLKDVQNGKFADEFVNEIKSGSKILINSGRRIRASN